MPLAVGVRIVAPAHPDEVVWFVTHRLGLFHALVSEVPPVHGSRGRAKRLAYCGRWLEMRASISNKPNFAAMSSATDSPFCWHCVLKVAPPQ